LLYSKEKGFETDKLYLKELYKKDRFSLNFGGSMKNLAFSVGYIPKRFLNLLEFHGMLASSWKDVIKLKLKPKVGIGFTINF